MAQKGGLYLKSASLLAMYNEVHTYESTVQDALYEQYKAAYKISKTNYMRGDAADSFKNYFTQGTINMIQGILDISSEMTMMLQLITEVFYQFESQSNGQIRESALDSIGSSLAGYKTTYDGMTTELVNALSAASQYITITPVDFDDVDDSYGTISSKIQSIRDDLYSMDDFSLTSAEELLARINAMKEQLTKTMGLCYKDGNFIPASAETLSKQSWYKQQTNATLVLLLAEDPFEYEAGAVSISEDQWAAGLCSDIYAYAGYSIISGSYEAGIEDNTAFMKARGSILNLNGYAQITDYAKLQGEAKVGYGEADLKAGAGDGYFGVHAEVEGGLIKVNGSFVVGSEEFNVYIKGDAKVCCADGKVAFEFEDDGEFAIGVDASATLASASVEFGTSYLSYEVDTGTATERKKDSLFKLKVGAKADAGGSFALYADSKTAIETDYININATSVKIDASFLIGAEIDVTFPTPYFKWPW